MTLATTASNGARVFDLRAPASDRPARLASKEPGQRWASAFHVGEEIFTVSTAGDVFAWARKDEAMSYAAPFRTARAHRDAAYVGKKTEADGFASFASASIRDSAFSGVDASFRVPAFACSVAPLGLYNTRVVLTASGDRGERVRAWDAESGDTLAEWGADGAAADSFGAAGAFGARGFAGVAHAPVTALCWGSGPEGERFGKTSFAVWTAEGIVRVYGP